MKMTVSSEQRQAFTLIELLVIVAIIAVTVAMLLPRLAGSHRSPAKSTRCLGNLRQCSMAWYMYADEHDKRLMYNYPPGVLEVNPTNNWITGVIDWSGAAQNTNALREGQLSTYFPAVATSGLLHCPADPSAVSGTPRVRSYSMNAFVGDTGGGPTAAGWKQFVKMSDFTRPSATFLFVDEHPNSIDDGCFVSDPAQTNAWIDLPGSSHNGNGALSFADGHVEMHKWRDRSTRQPFVPNGPKPRVTIPSGESNLDLAWFLPGATEKPRD